MKRRKFYRSKFQPDRGWIVGFNNIQLTSPSTASASGVLFDMSDIDSEVLTGRIEADKSDWFVKRVIFECYAAAAFANVTATDTARVYQLGMGVMGNANVESFMDGDLRVLSGETFNLWARQFRTWSKPVYAGCVIPFTTDATGDAVVKVSTGTSNPDFGFGVTAPFWGPSGFEQDFEVTNAGLRNNQSCVWLVSGSEGPASYDWDAGDILYLTINYRVLVQKRRT